MAEKSLFFNAFPDSQSATGYDRNYSADDISDWFQIVLTTGVVKGGFTLSSGGGLSINVGQGKATIRGKGYINDTTLNLPIDVAPVGSKARYDLIVLRMNNIQTISARKTNLMIINGGTDVPNYDDLIAKQVLLRNNDVYDLMLGYVQVNPNVTSIEASAITSKLGDANFCPYFVAVKGYDDYYDAIIQQFEYNVTLTQSTTLVVTNLATKLYNQKHSLIEVYCNGLKEENTRYTIGTDSEFITIKFNSTKNANSSISVVLNNFIDGEGLNTALSQYNELVNDVATLKSANEFIYMCNGMNDNGNISNLVNTFINGGTDYGSMKLKVVGNFGCNNGTSYPITMGGDGSSANPYRIFNFVGGNRKVVLDFSNCSQIDINVSGVYVNVFNNLTTTNLQIFGLNMIINATNSGTSVKAFNAPVTCEDCRFWINGYTTSYIANGGTFTNCRGSVSNASGNSYCFLNTTLLRINGGEYLAYTGQSSARSAIVGQSAQDAVSVLYGVSAPTLARSGYYQVNALYQVGSNNWINCTDLISALPLYVTTGASNIRGTIALSK